MKHPLLAVLTKSTLGIALAVIAASSFVQAKKEVTFAHQDMVFPYRTVMESGELEKATGYKINWRMFGGGGDVIKAVEKDVPEAMAQFTFPDNAAQAFATWLGGGAAKTLANTSAFLKEQGRLQEVKLDDNAFIDMSDLKDAMK